MGLRPQLHYEKPNRRVDVSGTVSEAVAGALENAKTLQEDGLDVAVTDIMGPATSLAVTHG